MLSYFCLACLWFVRAREKSPQSLPSYSGWHFVSDGPRDGGAGYQSWKEIAAILAEAIVVAGGSF